MAPLFDAATVSSLRRASSIVFTPVVCHVVNVSGLVVIEPSHENLFASYCAPSVPTACTAINVFGNMPMAVPSCGAIE
jgi:hypothetical protein